MLPAHFWIARSYHQIFLTLSQDFLTVALLTFGLNNFYCPRERLGLSCALQNTSCRSGFRLLDSGNQMSTLQLVPTKKVIFRHCQTSHKMAQVVLENHCFQNATVRTEGKSPWRTAHWLFKLLPGRDSNHFCLYLTGQTWPYLTSRRKGSTVLSCSYEESKKYQGPGLMTITVIHFVRK